MRRVTSAGSAPRRLLLLIAMLTSKTFRLKRVTFAIATTDGNRTAVSLPVGAVIHVIGGQTETDTRMVDVQWLGNSLVMFAIDVLERGEER
jgi:hypothetical protein